MKHIWRIWCWVVVTVAILLSYFITMVFTLGTKTGIDMYNEFVEKQGKLRLGGP